MRVVRLTEPRKLELSHADAPTAGDGNVIIDVSACGICGSDLHYWEMGVGLDGAPGLVLGHEFCGTVADPGPRKDLEKGDRVTYIPLNPCGECPFCARGLLQLCASAFKRAIPGNNAPGAFAEQVTGRADMVRKLPDTVSDEEACLVEPAAVALHAVRQADIRIGDRVLVTGGGTIGLLSAAWAKLAGAGFVGLCEVNSRRIEYAGQLDCVDQVFDAKEKKVKRELKEATGGGFDAVIETSASDAGLATAISALLPRGVIVLAGISFSPQVISTLAFTSKELVQKGSMAYGVEEFDTALDFIADGRLNVGRLVNRTIRFEDLQDVFEQLGAGEPEIIKAVVRP